MNQDLCGYLTQNIPVDQQRQQAGQGEAPPLWYRVKGGRNGYPRGHIANPVAGEEDYYAIFDVKNYQHRPLDRGFLVVPNLPLIKTSLCVRLISK